MSDPATYTVGWICALVTEYVAAKVFLDEEHPRPESLAANDTNQYCLGSIRDHKVVIAVLPDGEYGTASAANVATNLLRSFPSVRVGLMVGIGGGAPSPKNDIRLGDVVVSVPRDDESGVFQYDFGKIHQDQPFQNTRVLNQPPAVLRAAIAELQSEHEINGNHIEEAIESVLSKNRRLKKKYEKPRSELDLLFKSTSIHDGCCAGAHSCEGSPANLVPRQDRDVDELLQTHYGTIASSNQLMKDAVARDHLSSKKNILCFEMEAAGLMNHFPCIAIRGICDYSDSHKNKQWQGYAAFAAAAYAKDLLVHIIPSSIAGEKKITDILSAVLDSTRNVQSEVRNVASQLRSEQEQRILDWLSDDGFGAKHSDSLARRSEDTGLWLLNSSEYQQWRDISDQVLFCPGIPGSGKTILASVIIEDLSKELQHDSTVALAYMYCNFRQEYSVTKLFASLLKQLCTCQSTSARTGSTLPRQVIALHEKHHSKGTRPQLREILDALQRTSEGFQRVFFVVDALDEWKPHHKWENSSDLLTELLRLQKDIKGKLLVTSRPLPEIRSALHGFPTLEIVASEGDIGKYVDDNLSHVLSFVDVNPQLLADIRTEVIQASQGMFLLAYLYLESFRDQITTRELMLALNRIKAKNESGQRHRQADIIGTVYEEAMERIHSDTKSRSQLADRVLSWISCAATPLSTLQLQHALAVDLDQGSFDHDNIVRTDVMVSVCCGLVTVETESRIIRLVHYTTQEYFEQKQNMLFEDAHDQMATACTSYLRTIPLNYSYPKSTDLSELDSWQARKYDDGSQAWYMNSSSGMIRHNTESESQFLWFLEHNPLFNYASSYWAFHLSKAGKARATQSAFEFLRDVARTTQTYRVRSGCGSYPALVTGLHLAAVTGLIHCMDLLLQEIAIESLDTLQKTPLMWATEGGHAAAVEFLIKNGARLDSKDISGTTALHLASREGHLSIVEILLGEVCVVGHAAHEANTLKVASISGHDIAAWRCNAEDFPLDVHDEYGWRPLHYAVDGDHFSIAKALLEAGSQADHPQDVGAIGTPLFVAAKLGRSEIIHLLMQHGADFNHRLRGRTPLNAAVSTGTTTDVELFLELGAEVDPPEIQGTSGIIPPLHDARHLEMARILLSHGADVNRQSQTHPPYLASAVHYLDSKLISLFAFYGADVNIQYSTEIKIPLLIAAAKISNAEVIRELVSCGADTLCTDDDGCTPLICAIKSHRVSTTKALLGFGTGLDDKIKDSSGQTARDHAAKSSKGLCCQRPFTENEAGYEEMDAEFGFSKYFQLIPWSRIPDTCKAMAMLFHDAGFFEKTDGCTQELVVSF